MRLIFLHIPRTGGMSLRSIFDQQIGVSNIGKPWWGEHVGEQLTKEDKQRQAWYGHFRFGLHKYLPPDVRYITILRHPIERFISEYNRNDYRHKKGFTPLQLLNNLDQCFGFDGYGDNLQVRLLAGETRTAVLTDEHVKIALSNLREHFVHVGFTDMYEQTMSFLCGMGWQFNPIHTNAGKNPSDVTCEEVDDLKQSPGLSLDMKLWNILRGGCQHA